MIDKLREKVKKVSTNPGFIHHEWFVEYHLAFVEKIALELCDIYKEADRDVVLALVWTHDYAKILDKNKEHDETMLKKVRKLLFEVGFENAFINKIIELLSIFEKKMEINLREAPIEVQIVSSSDAASHFIGPFFSIYYRENPTMSTAELMASNRDKILKDWERKVVLPEVKQAFQHRFNAMMEQTGDFPEKYFSN